MEGILFATIELICVQSRRVLPQSSTCHTVSVTKFKTIVGSESLSRTNRIAHHRSSLSPGTPKPASCAGPAGKYALREESAGGRRVR